MQKAKNPAQNGGAGFGLSGGQADFTSSIKFLHAKNHNQQSGFTHLTLAELTGMAKSPRVGSKNTAPCFAPHDAKAKTKAAAAAAMFHVLIADFDDGSKTRQDIEAMFSGMAYLAWTSSSHTPDAPRWKAVIPLSRPIGANEWLPIAQGLALLHGGDEAQARIQQVSYLPNKLTADAPYEYIDRLDGGEPLNPTGSIAQAYVAAFEQDRLAKATQAVPKPINAPKGSTDIISMTNAAYSVRNILEQNGYQRRGKLYLAPNSSSGVAGVHILVGDDGRERVYSHHSSDVLADGHSHDAFDLLLIFRFAGNMSEAIKVLANELDSEGQAQRQRDYMQAQDAVQDKRSPNERFNDAWQDVTTWPDCEPLATPRDSLPYPLEALPPILCDAVIEVEAYVQAPLELIATSALTACSAVVQARCDVNRDSRLKAPSSLYSLILAESGERKTAVDGLFMQPIHDYDRLHREEGKQAMKAYESELDVWDVIHKALAANLSKAVKGGMGIEAAQKAVADSLFKKPQEPRMPSLLLDDATPEAIVQKLVKRWPVGYLATSEGGSFFGGHGMKDETIMRNLATFNSRWEGGRSKVERSNAAPVEVDGVRLAACVMVQPHVLDSFMRTAGTVARGSGFLARFLVTWPKSTQGSRMYTEPGAMPSLTKLQGVMRNLLDTAPPVNDAGQAEPQVLELSAQGFEAWREVYNLIEKNLAGQGEYADIRDSASKAADNVARIAGIFHELESRAGKIQADSITNAAEVVLYHLREVQRLFDGVAVPEPVQHAQELEAWIHSRTVAGVATSLRDILQFHPSSKLRKKETRNAAIAILEGHGRARVVMDGRTKMIELNPDILRVKS